jgi:predicted aldo/keto reductase-like oxidoreductase
LIEIKFPKTLKNILNDTTTNAELSLRFSMSNPGSNSILLGVTDLSHLDEAISLLGKDLIHIDDYSKILMGE